MRPGSGFSAEFARRSISIDQHKGIVMTLSINSQLTSNRFGKGALVLAALSIFAPRTAGAVPVNGFYAEDGRCDAVPSQTLTHEIGDNSVFPIDESLLIFVSQTPPTYACVGDDGAPNDFVVQITNLSNYQYSDLFLVMDTGITFGNADGNVIDVVNAPGVTADAMRIDGTVTVTGINDNLIGESGTVDELLDPGETWRFVVTNVIFPASYPPTLQFDSVGGFSGSSAGFPPSTASILANQHPVPEPSTVLLVGLGLVGLAVQRRRA
jgi:hypothetical protein